MPDGAHQTASTSPKKFFRALNSSPFRQNKNTPRKNTSVITGSPTLDLDNDGSPSFAFHSRSHSHDLANHSRKQSGQMDWTHLIPPIPKNPRSDSRSSSSSNSNRHTIAVSPNASSPIPDSLQPSTNPEYEKTFVLSRSDRPSVSGSPFVTSVDQPEMKTNDSQTSSNNIFSSSFSPSNRSSPLPAKLGPNDNFASSGSRSVSNTPRLQQQSNHHHHKHHHSHSNPKYSQNTPKYHASQKPKTPPPNASLLAAPNQQLTELPRPSISEHRSESSDRCAPNDSNKRPSLMSQNSSHAVPASQDSLSSSLPLQQNPKDLSQANQQKLSRDTSNRKRKICKTCKQVINGQFVRALNNSFHIECFKCQQCGSPCSSKFFPHEVKDAEGNVDVVPLCEYDYFKKLDLICANCDSALRGPYITALGNKYHLEHFKCSACGKVFESDESYYEHDNEIYCHYHYSKLFATKCEGCQSSIVKQFVELFKSGKVQQWHPECYMVFKFWNVSLSADSIGIRETISPNKSSLSIEEISPKDLALVEQKIELTVMNCWVVLSGFEETSASCISEMLLAACTGKRKLGLQVTGKLILILEILFRALDLIQDSCVEFRQSQSSAGEPKIQLNEEVYSLDAFDKFLALRKEPRNISGKLMSYLAILRKSNQLPQSGSLSADLLAVVTGCAHYLKLLIRIGLHNALQLNRLSGNTTALDGFLSIIRKYEEVEVPEQLSGESKKLTISRLTIPSNATDACRSCGKSIEKSCIQFHDSRWHNKCFECSNCGRKPSLDFKIETFLCGPDDSILCTDCSRNGSRVGMGYTSGFMRVSDLSQLIYLLKIAISRSRLAIKKEMAITDASQPSKTKNQMMNIAEEPSETETTYSKTLDEVTTLRQKRESQKLRNSAKKDARKSVILEAPVGAIAKSDNTSEASEASKRKGSTSSSLSFSTSLRDSDQFDFHSNPVRIQDDPPHKQTSSSLDRTSDLLKNEKSLTLDDIPRIVAAEQAREQRPNAFKHHNSLYQKKNSHVTTGNNPSPNMTEPKASLENDGKSKLKTKYFSELTKQEHDILRQIAIEALLEINNQYTREDLLALIQPKKQSNFWDKFKFGGSGSDKNKPMNVFGSDLKDVTRKYGVDSSLGVGPSQLRIPIVVEDIILALRQKDMSVEGIFRLNGNIKNLRELTDVINTSPQKSPELSSYSAVQLAALMKKWLRELPDPLLTFNLYELWISSRKVGDTVKAKRILHLSYCLLPRSHRNLLEVLLYFFSWVASFAEIDEETGSKMDTHNLATVIAPNILLSRSSAEENGEAYSSDAHFLAIEVVNHLIDMHEDLAVIPPDIWEFFNKCQFNTTARSENLSPKEIASKISKTYKEHPKYFSEVLKQESHAGPSHQNTIRRGQAKIHRNE